MKMKREWCRSVASAGILPPVQGKRNFAETSRIFCNLILLNVNLEKYARNDQVTDSSLIHLVSCNILGMISGQFKKLRQNFPKFTGLKSENPDSAVRVCRCRRDFKTQVEDGGGGGEHDEVLLLQAS